MSERVEDLLEAILTELTQIRTFLKFELDIPDPDTISVLEAIDHLGSRLTGGFGNHPDTDLGDVARAISSVETTIDLK
jgi:hypothetical protein